MVSKYKIAFALYGYNVIYTLVAGLLFTFSGEFFPFHSDVIGVPWAELEAPQRMLYLGMMRTEGAGFLASATAIGILLMIPFRQGLPWTAWAMTLVGTVEHFPTLVANDSVAAQSNASPPWPAAALGIATLVLGWFLSRGGLSAPNGVAKPTDP